MTAAIVGSLAASSWVTTLGCGSDSGAAATLDELASFHPELELPVGAWSPASVEEDPFIEFAEGRVRCSPLAFRVEAWFEVITLDCNYATLVNRIPSDVAAGDVITGEVAWSTIASPEPAVGTVAFATARDGALWRHQVSIPADPDVVVARFALEQMARAGSAIYFNVRNHGYNNWQVSPLTVAGPD